MNDCIKFLIENFNKITIDTQKEIVFVEKDGKEGQMMLKYLLNGNMALVRRLHELFDIITTDNQELKNDITR